MSRSPWDANSLIHDYSNQRRHQPALIHLPITLLRQSLQLQPSKYVKMPSTQGTEFDIFEDRSPPSDVKDIIIAAHDRANARGEEALGLAWWNCYERAQVDAAVANLLWAFLQQRATPQDQTTFRNSFIAPARVVVARRKKTTLVERHPNVANGQFSVYKRVFLCASESFVVYRQLLSMRCCFIF